MKKNTLAERIKQLKNKNDKEDIYVYYSGFCFTDNVNFAFFNVSEQFIVDNRFSNVLSFKMLEDDLQMLIDRETIIKPSTGIRKVTFDDYGVADRIYFNMFKKIDSSCLFCPVIEWFGQASNRLIVGLPNIEGKPIGVIKTVKGG